MATYVFGTGVVTAVVAVNLREFSRRLDKGECDGMFISALSATGLAPATHYISSGLLPKRYAETITDPQLLYTRAKKAWEDAGDIFPYTQLQVTNALAQCTFSNGKFQGEPESPFEMMARLGLQPVSGIL
jgi:hypothetical protein